MQLFPGQRQQNLQGGRGKREKGIDGTRFHSDSDISDSDSGHKRLRERVADFERLLTTVGFYREDSIARSPQDRHPRRPPVIVEFLYEERRAGAKNHLLHIRWLVGWDVEQPGRIGRKLLRHCNRIMIGSPEAATSDFSESLERE